MIDMSQGYQVTFQSQPFIAHGGSGTATQTSTTVTDIMEDDEDESVESLVNRLPVNVKLLEEFITGSQGCLLLLMLKQHLKDMYGLTEA